LRVAAGGSGVRTVALSTDQPLTVTARVPGRNFTATETVAAGASARIAVDADGGDITLACGAPATCTVVLTEGT
jgi:hypothetical protein